MGCRDAACSVEEGNGGSAKSLRSGSVRFERLALWGGQEMAVRAVAREVQQSIEGRPVEAEVILERPSTGALHDAYELCRHGSFPMAPLNSGVDKFAGDSGGQASAQRRFASCSLAAWIDKGSLVTVWMPKEAGPSPVCKGGAKMGIRVDRAVCLCLRVCWAPRRGRNRGLHFRPMLQTQFRAHPLPSVGLGGKLPRAELVRPAVFDIDPDGTGWVVAERAVHSLSRAHESRAAVRMLGPSRTPAHLSRFSGQVVEMKAFARGAAALPHGSSSIARQCVG